MAIRRGPVPADRFTIIDNAWLRDSRISWKAKGLLAYIASHAPGHQLTVEQILAESTDGRDAVQGAMRELEDAGYLHRTPLRDERGRAAGTDYELTDPGSTGAGKPVPGDDQEEQDVPAGQVHNGFSGAGESATKKTTSKNTKKTTPSASPRGTRLPDDWMPSESIKEWCQRELPAELFSRAGTELIKFRNYYTSKTGKDATRLDWDKTFQNWMINARDRYGVRPVSGPPAGEFRSARRQNADEDRRLMEVARVVDELMEQHPGAKARDLRPLAEEIVAKRSTSSAPVGYIDGEVIGQTGLPEVTS